MPTITLDNEDIKKALNFLTNNKYEINTIVSKKIDEKGNLEIFWSYKVI